ncbi:3-deoxy-D-manno-octulosonic acid transferase [Chryseosolibacter indicus]|uniref:3-deoxy-D-manno-octulosonic acid transferase n=1 Tax=Chryseosolibacter indicus TaxID=2782351 RepID=A0ABS5VPR3_9BACT|nr:glycosyltransferase N-terminal domain-containing protein [Chryseosolibacter indicus]MBT1702769.1 3-deoxy-D-manno-octulosonic acid transferase [Chryseosolibacter indicus]
MTIIYSLSIYIVQLLIKVASLFNTKAKAFVTGRRQWANKLKDKFAVNTFPVVWVHCASLGEFEQGRPIIEAIRKQYPQHKILLTFFSPSGYEVRKNYELADYVCYLPWDTAKNAKLFIETVKPVLAIFVKYEFWYHYAVGLKKYNVPLISISSIFRSDQFFFHSLGGFYRRILKNFSYFFVQNSESVKLLQSIGINSVAQTGDTRFDRVYQVVKQADEIEIVRNFKGDQRVFVIGSSWPEDMDILIPFINENRLKFIVAPHEISEVSITNLEKALRVKSIRYSQASGLNLDDYTVLIIDNIGMLSKLYRYGEFAYIGGGFGKGLHNILEAACYGVPVLFGNKNYERFQEAVDLINRGGAFEIRDYPDLKAKYEMLNVPSSFLLACEVTKQYVEENLGATEKIMQYCNKVLAR